MNRYICPDCGGYQYTANPNAAGSKCIYCGKTNVKLDTEGVPNDRTEETEMIKGKLKVIGNNYVEFYCPGCKETHRIKIGGTEHPMWGFNGNYDAPTFTPSILVKSGHYCDHAKADDCWCHWSEKHPDEPAPFYCYRCHSFITDGKIQYLGDCTHELAGQTVDMVTPEEPEETKHEQDED